MRKLIQLFLLLLSFSGVAQVTPSIFSATSSNKIPNYSSLDSYFTYFAPVTPATVFQDVSRTIPVSDGSVVKSIGERKSSKHIAWTSSDVRKGYYNIKYGATTNRDYPIYKFPAGDIPHIHYTNYLDVYLTNSTIAPIVGPVTKHFLLRSRRGVNFETLSSPAQVSLKDFSTTMQIGSTAGSGAFVTVTGSPLITEDVWTLVSVVLNGASSQLYYNGVQQGSNVNVGSGTVSEFGHGTISHIYEMDMAFDALNNSALTGSQILDIANAVNAIVPLGVLPSGLPYARNVNVTFDLTDTFNTTFTYVAGSGGIGIDASRTEYRWLSNDAGANGGNGLNGLDAQKLVYNYTSSSSIKRSNFPSYFRPGSIGVPNNANIACEVKVYDLNGRSFGWVSSRSRYSPDATAGAPDGTYAPVTVSGVIQNATPTKITITYSAALNTGTGLQADFTVTADGVTSPVTSISVSGSTVEINHTITPTNTSDVVLMLKQTATNPLKGSNGKTCESFVSSTIDGPFFKITNNIAGPQTVKANLMRFGNTTASVGWINLDYDWSTTGIKNSNMNDILGAASGIGINVIDGFDRANSVNSSPPTSADIPDVNITTRVQAIYNGETAGIRLYGFTPGKTCDVNLYFYYDVGFPPVGSGTGFLNFIDNTGTSSNVTVPVNSTLQKMTRTGLVADGSGNIDITFTSTANQTMGLAAIIFIKYP